MLENVTIGCIWEWIRKLSFQIESKVQLMFDLQQNQKNLAVWNLDESFAEEHQGPKLFARWLFGLQLYRKDFLRFKQAFFSAP